MGLPQKVQYFGAVAKAQDRCVSFQKDPQLIFADLPGYGYNVARQDIRKLWETLIGAYLERSCIAEFIYLMDIRRKFEDFELEYMAYLGAKVPLIVELTKSDKVNRKDQSAAKKFTKYFLCGCELLCSE